MENIEREDMEEPKTIDLKKESKSDIGDIGEIDYAILKSISYNVNKISDLVKVLQIRTLILERHLYRLFDQKFIDIGANNEINITEKGNDAILTFEKSYPDKFNPINDFILYVLKRQRERIIITYRIVDVLLLISMIIIILLIIYFGKPLIS